MYEFEVSVPFATDRHAKIALNSVIQDEEPRSGTMIERKRFFSKTKIIKTLNFIEYYFYNCSNSK